MGRRGFTNAAGSIIRAIDTTQMRGYSMTTSRDETSIAIDSIPRAHPTEPRPVEQGLASRDSLLRADRQGRNPIDKQRGAKKIIARNFSRNTSSEQPMGGHERRQSSPQTRIEVMKPLIKSNATNNSARLTPTAVDDATRVALSFLRGLAAMPHVQTTLREVGLTPDEQALGWKLVGNMVGIPDEAPSSNRALSALDMLDADGVSFYKRTEAPLRRLHPARERALGRGRA
jgi:hypothetical protein